MFLINYCVCVRVYLKTFMLSGVMYMRRCKKALNVYVEKLLKTFKCFFSGVAKASLQLFNIFLVTRFPFWMNSF